MSIFNNLMKSRAESRLTEEMIYAQVLEEIQNGIRRDGLWAKALAESNMDENSAKARYLILRVQSIKDEIEILEREKNSSANSKTSNSSSEKPRKIDFNRGSLGNSIKPYTCMNCNRNQNMLIKRKEHHPFIWSIYIVFGGALGLLISVTLGLYFNDAGVGAPTFLVLFPLSYVVSYYLFLRKTTFQCPTCGNKGDLV